MGPLVFGKLILKFGVSISAKFPVKLTSILVGIFLLKLVFWIKIAGLAPPGIS